jgi:hypothetical protein
MILIFSGPALAQDNVLSVTRTQEEIVIDGMLEEASWDDAIAATIETKKGTDVVNVELRALYDEQFVYFFAMWEDPSESVIPQQWQYTGGKWFSAPHKEDRMAMLWNTEDNIIGFEQNKQGCVAACHNGDFKTQSSEEIGDLWQWMAGRTNPSTLVPDVGWMDDASLDDTGVMPDEFAGSKIWEENSIYAHDDNETTIPFAANDTPKWMEGLTPPNDYPEDTFLFRGFETETLDIVFPDGKNLPGYLLSRPSGGQDRADISAKGDYNDTMNVWTLEFKRKLMTGNDGDVAFDNLLNSYHFGLAIFDNQAGGESYRSELITLRFDVPELNLLSSELSTTSPVLGDPVNVTVNIKNIGGYSTGFTAALYLDNLTNDPISTKPYTEMTSGLEDEFNFTFVTANLAPGKHLALVKVDADDIIPEHDENNNVIEQEFWVFPPISSFKASNKEPEVGSKITLKAVIDNPADEDANVTVVFYEGENVINTQIVNVTANGNLEVSYKWKASKEGKFNFKVELEGAVNTMLELKVNVKEESPGLGLFVAVLAMSLAAGIATNRHRRGRSSG